MEDKCFGLLYRNGSEKTINTIYMWHINSILTSDQQETARLEFVRRYNGISWEKADKICIQVGKYKGPQDTLIRKIDKILSADKPA